MNLFGPAPPGGPKAVSFAAFIDAASLRRAVPSPATHVAVELATGCGAAMAEIEEFTDQLPAGRAVRVIVQLDSVPEHWVNQ